MRVRGLEGTWGVLGGVAGRWGYVCVGALCGKVWEDGCKFWLRPGFKVGGMWFFTY